MSPKAITRCPRCGASVTPYAAGCSVCGFDLLAERRRRDSRRMRLPELPRPRMGEDARNAAVLIGIVVVLVTFISPIGVLLALWCAYDRHRHGYALLGNVLVALAVAGIVFLFVPSLNPLNLLGGV